MFSESTLCQYQTGNRGSGFGLLLLFDIRDGNDAGSAKFDES